MLTNAPTVVESLTRLLAAIIAGQALRQMDAQNNNRPSVRTTGPAYTPERTPAQRGPRDAN